MNYPENAALGLNRHRLHATVLKFPVACLSGALLTSLLTSLLTYTACLRTSLYLRSSFSVWMLAAGCVFAGVAGIVGNTVWRASAAAAAAAPASASATR